MLWTGDSSKLEVYWKLAENIQTNSSQRELASLAVQILDKVDVFNKVIKNRIFYNHEWVNSSGRNSNYRDACA